ncbi:MAG: type IV pilus assembly protein PilM [Actinobacteria bacterium]|nr:type IV pilus assembly protein PilM [Actinomycetota bacterium]
MGSSIGLDIGSSAVRVVQVSAGRRGDASVDRVGEVALPPDAIRDGAIEQPDLVAGALKALWSRHKLRSRRVTLGVASQQVVVRQVDLPWMPERELRASLRYTAQDYIPISVDEALLDIHPLEEVVNDEGQRFARVLLVAAHRQLVDELLAVVKRARLEPVVIDLEPFAILRSLAGNRTIGGYAEVLIDIGADVTNVVVHEAGVPGFTRILPMGGAAITDSLVGTLDMSVDEAEAVKAATGLPAPDGGSDGRVAELIADRARRLMGEIRGSLDYYNGQAGALPIDRAVVSGGGSRLPNLREQLARTLQLPVDRGHPLQRLSVAGLGVDVEDLVDAEPTLAVAVGLAMRPSP